MGLQEDMDSSSQHSLGAKPKGLIPFPEGTRLFLTSGPLHSLFLYSYNRC